MAFQKKQTAHLVRRAPSVPKARYEALVKARHAAQRKAGEVARQRMGSLAGVAACAAVGWAEKNGKMPALGGFEPTVVLGLALGFVVPSLVKGKAGQMCAEAGAALSGVAAYKLATGAPLRVGEDDGDL